MKTTGSGSGGGGGKRNKTEAAAKKESKGRQKIEIKKVENNPHRHVTFSKRKNGMFKKAIELSTLCGAQVAVVLFSQHQKVYSCGHPDFDYALRRYDNITASVVDDLASPPPLALINNNVSVKAVQEEQEYVWAVERLEEAKRRAAAEATAEEAAEPYGGGLWWETAAVEGMDEKEEVQCYRESVVELKERVLARLQAMQ